MQSNIKKLNEHDFHVAMQRTGINGLIVLFAAVLIYVTRVCLNPPRNRHESGTEHVQDTCRTRSTRVRYVVNGQTGSGAVKWCRVRGGFIGLIFKKNPNSFTRPVTR